MDHVLLTDIGELITLEPLTQRHTAKIGYQDLGRIKNAWLYVKDGKVQDYGSEKPPQTLLTQSKHVIDVKGQLVLPGLVDSHTHPIFFGSRYLEFTQRVDGKTYQEIAQNGGGIKASVKATRHASFAELQQSTEQNILNFSKFGVTTIEAKSGYGLSVLDELKLLEILDALKKNMAQHLVVTCLALHAVPDEFSSAKEYAVTMKEKLLPQLAKKGFASYVYGFIENGYFSIDDVEDFFLSAKKLGFKIRLHADEFSDSKGAEAAARWGADSADHLQYASAEGIKDMAEAHVTATILPGTSLYSKIPFTDAKKFIRQGCSVAVATDFNPGSCTISNLPLMAALAGLHGGLSTPEAIAGVTYVPAVSLGLKGIKGALARGYDGDFLIHPFTCVEHWLADMGQTLPNQVWIKGKLNKNHLSGP